MIQSVLLLYLTLFYYQISSTKWDTTSAFESSTIFWPKIGTEDARICRKRLKLFNQLSNSISTFNLKSENGMTLKTRSGRFYLYFQLSIIQLAEEGFRFRYLQKKRLIFAKNWCLKWSSLVLL